MLITGEPDRCPSSSLWRAERSRLRQQCSDQQVGLTLRHDNHINRLILSERRDALWQKMTEAVIEATSLTLNLEMDPDFQVPSDKTMRHCSASHTSSIFSSLTQYPHRITEWRHGEDFVGPLWTGTGPELYLR